MRQLRYVWVWEDYEGARGVRALTGRAAPSSYDISRSNSAMVMSYAGCTLCLVAFTSHLKVKNKSLQNIYNTPAKLMNHLIFSKIVKNFKAFETVVIIREQS